jgi:hypothetical protein
MAKTQAQTTTGRTRIKNGLSVTLYGAGAKGHEGTLGGVAPVGAGLEPGVVTAVPAGQVASPLQVEQPEGTPVAGIDSTFGLMTGGNLASRHYTIMVPISAANITDAGAGHLGHANGYTLVAAPGAGYCLELEGAVMSYAYLTAAYTGGGNVTVNVGGGGSALTGVISAASSLGAGASNITQFVPLSAAGLTLTANTGLALVAASAFTQPGTAAGTVKVFVTYRVHKL